MRLLGRQINCVDDTSVVVTAKTKIIELNSIINLSCDGERQGSRHDKKNIRNIYLSYYFFENSIQRKGGPSL